jgi:hypothetical protein
MLIYIPVIYVILLFYMFITFILILIFGKIGMPAGLLTSLIMWFYKGQFLVV